MIKKILKLGIPLMIAAMSHGAVAGFINEAAPAKPAGAATPQAAATPAKPRLVSSPSGYGMVTFEGRTPAVIPPAKGMGKGMALRDALGQFVPAHFQVYADEDVRLDKKVDWNGKPEWTQSLMEVVRGAGYGAVVNWDEKSVTLKTSVSGKAADAKTASWSVKTADRTVRGALARWAREAGWQLAWEVNVDFPILLEAAFTGSFENAVQSVMLSLSETDNPVKAIAYDDNRVIRVVRYGDQRRPGNKQ